MKYATMYEAIQKILDKEEQIDYVLSGESARRIELWSNMYQNKAPWISDTVQSIGLPASISGEIARLTTLELQSHISGSPRAEYLDKFYQRVCGKLRIQTEYAFAKGSMAFKPYPTEKGIAVQYIQADCFFPLEYDSEQITRCAFLDQFRKGQEIYSRIELHHIQGNELSIRNRVFVSRTDGILGSEISIQSVPKWAMLAEEIRFRGYDKLPFGYFKVPLGNNEDSDNPLGTSVFARADKLIREADERYSQISWEYKGKETAVHLAQSLLKYRPETDSWSYPAGMQRLYRTVEYNSGAVDKPFMEVYSPDIRDESFFNGLNKQLRLIEFACNLAYGTLSDPNNTDKTAEEIKASKQRSYSFVSDCQTALQTALEDLVDAMNFWCDVYSLAPSGACNTSFSWDDSIVVDADKEREQDRQDVAMGAMQLWEYRVKWYGETEEQAKAAVQQPAEVIE